MNLFVKSYKYCLLFFLLSALNTASSLGQRIDETILLAPQIQTIDIPSRYNMSPNTSFVRDDRGVMYIGKENGILTIDGEEIYFTAFESPVYLALDSSQQVTYLSSDDFGIITYDGFSSPAISSKLLEIRSNHRIFYPYNITAFQGAVFMATTEGVIRIIEDRISHFFFDRKSKRLFNAGQEMYLEMEDGQILKWDGENFTPEFTLPGEMLSSIISLCNWNDLLLFCGKDQQKGAWSAISWNPVSYPAISRSANPQVLSWMHNDLFLGLDEHQRYCIVSPVTGYQSPLLLNEDLEKGIPVDVFVDHFGDLWILSEFQLKKVEFPASSAIMDLVKLKGGSILSTVLFNDLIYVAASKGLFRMEEGYPYQWKSNKISEPRHGLFSAIAANERYIVAAGTAGLFEVDDNVLTNIDPRQYTFLEFLPDHSLIAAGSRGLDHYQKMGEKWMRTELTNVSHRIISGTTFDDRIWLLSSEQELLEVSARDLKTHPLPNISVGTFNNLMVLDGKLILVQEAGFFSWNSEKERFEENSSHLASQLHLSKLIVDGELHYWSIHQDQFGRNTLWLLGQDQIHSPYYEIPAVTNFGQVVDIDENNSHIWITGSNKLIRLDQQPRIREPERLVRIQSVEFTELKKRENKFLVKPGVRLKYKRYAAEFQLADVRYQKDPAPYYRYRINSYQERWSEWQRDPVFRFGPLLERDYHFEAQSVSSFGQLSEPVSFRFSIEPPFYRTWYAFIYYVVSIAAASFFFYKWRLLRIQRVESNMEARIKERMAYVLTEKEKSDKLVADLFPKGTIEELKNKGRAKSQRFDMATVLFSDIQGFTKIAEEMNPELLIDELDKFFFHFDSVVEKYNIEKIKTIGDAYMAAGGIPIKNRSNPVEVVLAGLEMQYYMKDLKKKKADIWDLRIGIHTGPVISGVVGHKKLSYDIWGDTVNTASRMESSGEGGKVNISGTTYSLVKDFFICEYRGKLPVKYKGNIDMYFVTGIRPELSVDLQGVPNKKFFIKLQLVRLQDLEDRIWEGIEANHSVNLHFHKLDYLQHVMNQTEILGRSENLSEDDLLLVKSAALLMYAGLADSYENVQNKSAEMAREILSEFAYDDSQIDRISNLILSAKPPYNPQNILEEILIDARMEYLGRSDYVTLSKLKFLEEKNLKNGMTKETFVKNEIAVLENFRYFTIAAQRLREIPAEEQIARLKEWK